MVFVTQTRTKKRTSAPATARLGRESGRRSDRTISPRLLGASGSGRGIRACERASLLPTLSILYHGADLVTQARAVSRAGFQTLP